MQPEHDRESHEEGVIFWRGMPPQDEIMDDTLIETSSAGQSSSTTGLLRKPVYAPHQVSRLCKKAMYIFVSGIYYIYMRGTKPQVLILVHG
jgi:hypothetical protein